MNKYTIGDASKLCHISTKTLRYYDKIGLVKSLRSNANNYRYYDDNSLLLIPVIKYYKQMGFTLEEMTKIINQHDDTDQMMLDIFQQKMNDFHREKKEWEIRYSSVHDWFNLIQEAQSVQQSQDTNVSVLFFPGNDYLFLKQSFDENIQSTVINIEFTEYVEQLKAHIAGPIILKFNSYQERISGVNKTCILQKAIFSCPPENTMFIGAQSMVRCYHIGSHKTIKQTYDKITKWAESNDYSLENECYERYVLDYWTSRDSNKFITEVLIPGKKNISSK
ncbi:MAG: MerR family transcriptional regulator [Vibrio sp.]|uniref:MerR family transcriptional regulator n=1 Tax=Vibrio sp. TaxID=678 RepID=UPI003A8394F4